MDGIKRVYVEKKKGFDIEACHILRDLSENLNIGALDGLRLINRYDVLNIGDADFETCKNTVFSEPPVDYVHTDLEYDDGDFVFGVKYLPGQYDQRADSAAQCIQIVTGIEKPVVETAKIFICRGKLTDDDKARIKNYSINSVDSMEAELALPKTIGASMPIPRDIEILHGFITINDEKVISLKKSLGLAMSNEDVLFCRDYFRDEETRDPSLTEIRVLDTYWSDHCRHTTFLTALGNIEIEDGFYAPVIREAFKMYISERKSVYGERADERDITLMDLAVMGMKTLRKKGLIPDLDQSEEINAASIEVTAKVNGCDEKWLVMFKNETHNHPTEIEPFGGAATCLGGAIRDPLSGRSYVYQAMRVTGAGDPRTPIFETLPGKLPQRKITTGAAHGYSSYGNQIGLATGIVTEIYHPGYVAKRMETGVVVGAVKKENVVRKAPIEGDVVILVGGRTGRDGCGGATGSSKEHTVESLVSCGAEVQKGNPPTERKLMRLFRNKELSTLIKRCNDFGAGGVSVAVGELSDSLLIDLDTVPKKYDGLDGTELAISESQERMAVVVEACNVDKFIKFAADENLESVEVARVTDSGRLVMKWQGREIVSLKRSFLNSNGARHTAEAFIASPRKYETPKTDGDLKERWLENLSDLNVCSQKGLVERFDGSIGAGSVLFPYGGKFRLTPAESMCAKLPVLGETNTSTIMSFGYNPYLSSWSPFHGAVCAVIESVCKIAASGGDYTKIRLSFQEFFERLGEDKIKWGKPMASLLGGFYAQMKLAVPSIGGKDSMSGSFLELDVPPTLISFGICCEDAARVISPEFKAAGNSVILLTTDYNSFDLPDFEALKRNLKRLNELIILGKILSAHTVGMGGISAAVSKMAFGNGIGVEIEAGDIPVFEANYGSFVLEVGDNENIEEMFGGLNFTVLGSTSGNVSITVNSNVIPLEEAQRKWLSPLESVFPTEMLSEVKAEKIEIKPFKINIVSKSKFNITKPRVFIPVFPGTNCEEDTRAEFERAGAIVNTFVIKNLNINMLKSSIRKMTELIDSSQIIALPGGFSAGDEPEGSGKFIAAVFRNSEIKDAVTELINRRDGLILGICNGFQALLKLGLLPFGEIRDMDENSPTLTFNTIGRHISTLSRTKIVSNISPWLNETNVGDVHTIAFSHGEGRFAAAKPVLEELIENRQVAAQYVDLDGKASMDIRYNPNGSMFAIEALTSPDGRILGKMGHSERIGRNLYKNIDGDMEQKIFLSGVNYFS